MQIEARPILVPRSTAFAEHAGFAAAEAQREAALLKDRTLRLHEAAADDEEREQQRQIKALAWATGARRRGGMIVLPRKPEGDSL